MNAVKFSLKIPAHLQAMPPYTPIEPFEVLSRRMGRAPADIVKLDANENPYGPSPRARQALASLRFPHIYPDPESRELRQALSRFTGLPAEHLIAGSGVDELLDLLLRVVLEPGDGVLICPPTFGMYAFDTRLNAGRVVEAPRRPDFSLDPEAILRAVDAQRPKVLFLAAPNNPDGSLPTPDQVNMLLDLPLLVVLDEAYIEFSGLGRLGEAGSRIGQVPLRENLVVLRTFSKWAGLAGLRVGFGAFPGWLLPTLWKAKQPYNVNVAASAAAIASLEDRETLEGTVARLVEERERIARELAAGPFFRPYPSRANFVLCQVRREMMRGEMSTGEPAGSPGAAVKNALARQGIMVRYFDTPRLRDHIRISAGRPQDTDRLLESLRDLSGM
jgi:histidinol-phosphate aminotransferase